MSDREIREAERLVEADPSDEVAAERAKAARRRAGRATIEDVLSAVSLVLREDGIQGGGRASWPQRFGAYCHTVLDKAAQLGLDPALRRKLLSRVKPGWISGGWLAQAWLKAANDAAGPARPKPLPDAGPLFARKEAQP